MNSLVKIPYEISLWDDRLTLVDKDGKEYDSFVNAGTVNAVAQYYKEKKICVIGSHTTESVYSVVEPKLTRKTDGTSTLVFSIYAKYYDEETGEFKENPFLKYLTNERKVKLKYFPNGETRWLDFIIKKIEESSENHKFTYTATDLFINELSKTGYNLEFDTELEENQGTVRELADKILASTDWDVGEDNEVIQQTNQEPLYGIKLGNELTARNIFDGQQITIPSGETIYAFYSSVNGEDADYYQFIYNSNGKYITDENNVVYDVGNYYCSRANVNGSPELQHGFRGERYIRSQKAVRDKILNRTVNVYEKNGVEYRGYVESQYITPSLVTNYITNGQNIISASGWDQYEDGKVDVILNPSYEAKPTIAEGEKRRFGIEFAQDYRNQDGDYNPYLINSGIRDNAETIKEIAKNSKYVFAICGSVLNKDTGALSTLGSNCYFNVKVAKYERENGEVELGEVLFEGKATKTYVQDGKTFYYVKDLSPSREVSYQELTDISEKEKFGIFINVLKGSIPEDQNYFIEKVALFPQYEGKAGDAKGIILPSGHILTSDNKVTTDMAESYVSSIYRYYKANQQNVTDADQLVYEYIGETANNTYTPVYNYNFEKVRSISKKESNRFDLLQTLSETFECWCRFDIWHNETGEIMLGKDLKNLVFDGGAALEKGKAVFLGGTAYSVEDYELLAGTYNTVIGQASTVEEGDYRQLKFVTFHKNIGQKKGIGFRYGINLKSISRSLDSNNIATKLIVKSNNNEFAEGGSCNIASAKENPHGENFIYDFSHYIRQGLMNQTNLNYDLYITDEKRGWIGLYTQLKDKNKKRDKLITQQVSCSSRYSHNKSVFENAKIRYNASQEELSDLYDDYADTVGSSYNGSIPAEWAKDNKICGIAFNIERLKSEMTQLVNDYQNAEHQMNDLNAEIDSLKKQLQNIEEETATLIETFEKKYVRFIQEASWISEDYTDKDLYYLDAETTLHKSAQPKVSYTINVIELNQLEGYENYYFDLGDVTYIQDTDFFGWKEGQKYKTPHKEEIVITEMTTEFHSPEKSTIKAQNYRSAFEDLFQRLTATSQQLQFHSGEYARAADVVDANGNIAPGCLEDAFSNNAYILSNVANQSVAWDEYGITTTNTTNPAEIARITSGGIFLSDTGGEKWTTGITAQGINAKVITTGILNTELVNIYNENQKSFTWDSQGINAYKSLDGGRYSTNNFVRFNEHGIFGVDDVNKDFSNLQNIKDNSSFYLGWDGLHLNRGTIDWNSVSAPNKEQIAGLADDLQKALDDAAEAVDEASAAYDRTDEIVGKYLGAGGATLIGDRYVISPYIAGGYLHITNGSNSVTINPKQINKDPSVPTDIFKITTSKGEVMKINTSGDASFAGEITAQSGKIGPWNLGTIESGWSKNNSYPDSLWNSAEISGTKYLAFLRIPQSADGHVFSIRKKIGDNDASTIFSISRNGDITMAGNITLTGDITWGSNASPTQIVYASYKSDGTAPTKPTDKKAYSSFPSSATAGNWHQTFDAANDYFGSYTYDGGNTWGPTTIIKGKDGQNGQNGQNGQKGDTIKVIQAYYRSNSASPPLSWPSGSTYPSGWSTTPHGVTSSQKYEYISQCTVTNSTYGTWSDPVLFARYGSDGKNGENGSDATVNAINVFNALTSNGTMYGCFTGKDSKLYINAEYINTGILRVGSAGSEIFFADINNNKVEIGGWHVYKDHLGALGKITNGKARGIVWDNVESSWNNNARIFAIGEIGNGTQNTVDGIIQGNWGSPNFTVHADGTVTAGNLIAKGGSIGDWKIENLTLTSSDKYKHTYTGSCLYSLGKVIVDSTTSETGWDVETYGVYLTPDGIFTKSPGGYYSYKSWPKL